MTDMTSNTGSGSGLIVDRRQLMAGAAALGLSTAFASPSFAQDSPVKGGTFRLGMEGGSASDSLDPMTYSDSIHINFSLMFWNTLVEIDSGGNATPELFESWEAKPGASEWIFNVRKDMVFSNGKTLNADDVIYSINMHRGETKSPAADLLKPVTDIKKLSDTQVQITLSGGNADLPFALSDYHIIVVPDGFTDWANPIGTGAFTLETFEPGVRILAKRKDGEYWKPGRGNFDAVELRYILDAAARTQALVTNQVDAVNRLEPKTANLVMNAPNVTVVRSEGSGLRYAFVCHSDTAPFDDLDVRLGLKYGIDRQKIIDTVFNGFATLGNDHLISPSNKYFAKDLPQREYDPEKASFHFKKAGMEGPFTVEVSEGAYSGATDSAVLYQEALSRAGVTLEVKRVSGDGYWDNIWLKSPFSAVYWGSRPTADLQFSQTFLSTANWNDSNWKRPEFDALIIEARAELDEAKRMEMYAEAQRMVSDDGGMICFAVSDYLDGYSSRVRGAAPHARYDLNDHRMAEKGWFEG